MIRINLLPHRQAKRAQKQRQMVMLSGLTAGLGALIVLLGYTMLSNRIDYQNSRNKFLTEQVARLDAQIEEIKKVKEETAALLSRKQVVEGLQANRSEAVHVLDQLLRVIPDGTYLRSVKQSGVVVGLSGFAQSNARVSSLMRNLEDSTVFESPELVEIKGITVNNVRAAEFALNVKIARDKAQAAEEKNKKEKRT